MSKLSAIFAVVVGLVAFISSIAVSLINNYHQRKLRSLELQHDLKVQTLKINSDLENKRLDTYFQEKISAFLNLIDLSSKFYHNPHDQQILTNLYSAIYIASIHCTRSDCRNSVTGFADTVSSFFYAKTPSDLESFKAQMDYLSYALDCELYDSDNLKSTDTQAKEW